MRKLEVRLDWGDEQRVVGTLAEHERRIYFEYDARFLGSGIPISPFKLPLRAGLFEHADRDFAAVFGAFNDSLPDGRGLLLMDREFRKRGFDPATLTPLDRLAYIGTRGMGALTCHPPTAAEEKDQALAIDLAALARQAERVLEGSAEEVLRALRIAGGSPAGARPKVLVGVRGDGRIISGTSDLPEGFRHFLVKFGSREDSSEIGAVEAAYARMAGYASIDVPPARLFETADGGRYFGAERFDRVGNERVHMHTLGGLLHANHRVPSMEYEGFLRATLILTRDHRQVEEAFPAHGLQRARPRSRRPRKELLVPHGPRRSVAPGPRVRSRVLAWSRGTAHHGRGRRGRAPHRAGHAPRGRGLRSGSAAVA